MSIDFHTLAFSFVSIMLLNPMAKRPFKFTDIKAPAGVSAGDWSDWTWQIRHALKSQEQFAAEFKLSPGETQGFAGLDEIFRVQTTPYYASLMSPTDASCPIRRMIIPDQAELGSNYQQMLDPLGENKPENRACERLVHRYTDRALFLVTDMCGVYCRYCTRKHFTANDQVVASSKQVDQVVEYLTAHPEIKEVIFSGGDPLTISNKKLGVLLKRIYDVGSVELIRIGSRMPVACPMRIDDELIGMFKEFKPVYMMTHFNHPDEITEQSAAALERLVDGGVPVFNQLVLLNGINNHPALVYALSRRLLFLRVKPYYMFQADPSVGTDHLRTSIEDSLEIQRQLWGHASGLATPTYVVDIPDGGGKAPMTPVAQMSQDKNIRSFKGWDGVTADYISPEEHLRIEPTVAENYQADWLQS